MALTNSSFFTHHSRLARRCCGATNPCFGKCDDVGFGVVGEVVECGNMFSGEHGAGIEGADEVYGVGGTWIGLDVRHKADIIALTET